jgi:hypothetical protein
VLKNFDFNINLKHPDNACLHQILCEFCTDNHRYQILHLHDYSESLHLSSNATLLHRFQSSDFLEVSHFEINGNLYAVIEVGDTQSDSKVHLATLLTARELQIATLVATGCSNKQIAKQLHISEWTVATVWVEGSDETPPLPVRSGRATFTASGSRYSRLMPCPCR